MDPAKWTRVQRLFHEASRLPAAERARWLDERLAGEDAEVASEVRRMLAEGDTAGPEPPSPVALLGLDPLPSPAENLAGESIGGWRLLRELGRGGLGIVYEACAADGTARAAVKVLQPGRRLSPVLHERFRREAEAARRLDHPGIVKVLGAGEEGGRQYLAMELIEGRALSEHLAELRSMEGADSAGSRATTADPDLRRPRAVAELVARVADALAHSHREGVVHRDIKPQNILIDAGGAPRVVDFGLAKDQAELDSLSRTGEVFGTPHYMSPEQAVARRDGIDHRTDVYSLGAVMYEMLTLRRPFDGATSHEIFFKIVHDEPRPIRVLAPAVPRELALICGQAMRRSPRQRYESMGAFAADLRRFLAGERVQARPISLVQRLRGRMRGPRTLATAAGALLLAGVLGGAGFVASRASARAREVLPRLEVALPAGSPECDVFLLRMDALPPGGSPRWIGRTQGGRFEHRVQPGAVRLTLADGGGALGEFDRVLREGNRARIESAPVGLEATRGDWVRVEGGTVRHADTWGGGTPVEVEVAPFWLEISCVTNGQYRAYLEATGRPPPRTWRAVEGLLEDPERLHPRWADLPASGVSLADARAYCEWTGARLPTSFEWQRAAESLVPALEGLATEDAGRFVLGHPQVVLTPEGKPSTFPAYLAAVQPAAEGPAPGPLGLRHMLGNVYQWTSSTWLGVGPDGPAHRMEFQVARGAAWHNDRASELRPGSAWSTLAPVEGGENFEIGFRRARSDPP